MNTIAEKLQNRIVQLLQKDLDTTINIYIFLAKKGFAETDTIKSVFKLDDEQVTKHLNRLLDDQFIIRQQFEKELVENPPEDDSSAPGSKKKTAKTTVTKIPYFTYRVRNYAEYTWEMDLSQYFP